MVSALKRLDSKFLIMVGCLIGIPIFILLILAIMQGCGNKKISHSKYEEKMLEAAEKYVSKKNNELNEEEVVRKFGKTELSTIKTKSILMYNLDLVLAVGYRVNSKMGIEFRKWANKVLKEYLLKGYVINENRVTVSNENYIELRNEVVNINNRLVKLEDKVFNDEYSLNKIFFNGQYFDAYSLIQQIFESANNEIIIIDNYIDRSILDRLIVKKKSVKVLIYTNINTSKLLGSDIKSYNSQYRGLTVLYTPKVHDRFIIIDRNKLYHLGHSIKDLGKKIFSIIESDSTFIELLLKKL